MIRYTYFRYSFVRKTGVNRWIVFLLYILPNYVHILADYSWQYSYISQAWKYKTRHFLKSMSHIPHETTILGPCHLSVSTFNCCVEIYHMLNIYIPYSISSNSLYRGYFIPVNHAVTPNCCSLIAHLQWWLFDGKNRQFENKTTKVKNTNTRQC